MVSYLTTYCQSDSHGSPLHSPIWNTITAALARAHRGVHGVRAAHARYTPIMASSARIVPLEACCATSAVSPPPAIALPSNRAIRRSMRSFGGSGADGFGRGPKIARPSAWRRRIAHSGAVSLRCSRIASERIFSRSARLEQRSRHRSKSVRSAKSFCDIKISADAGRILRAR
jgi:hypothetical protein